MRLRALAAGAAISALGTALGIVFLGALRAGMPGVHVGVWFSVVMFIVGSLVRVSGGYVAARLYTGRGTRVHAVMCAGVSVVVGFTCFAALSAVLGLVVAQATGGLSPAILVTFVRWTTEGALGGLLAVGLHSSRFRGRRVVATPAYGRRGH